MTDPTNAEAFAAFVEQDLSRDITGEVLLRRPPVPPDPQLGELDHPTGPRRMKPDPSQGGPRQIVAVSTGAAFALAVDQALRH
jgi:hypothetical protein